MFNTIKISVIIVILVLILPKASYAGDNHHGHGFHSHANPDLTLVSGMDNIDNRVLIASDPDQSCGT